MSQPPDPNPQPLAPIPALAGREYHNVTLIGFMGVGKSTVGTLLADMLGFELVDTDKVIEQKEGRRISELFAQHGEPYFRACEAALVREMESYRKKVISTGGGMVTQRVNLESLRRHSLIVCLWASAETIYDRVRNQSHRPLLQAPDPLARIRELMDLRAPVYREAADIMVGVDYRHAPEVARHIARSYMDLARHRGYKHTEPTRPVE